MAPLLAPIEEGLEPTILTFNMGLANELRGFSPTEPPGAGSEITQVVLDVGCGDDIGARPILVLGLSSQ